MRLHFKETSPDEPNPDFFSNAIPCGPDLLPGKVGDLTILILRYFDGGNRNVQGWMKKKTPHFHMGIFLKVQSLLLHFSFHTCIQP